MVCWVVVPCTQREADSEQYNNRVLGLRIKWLEDAQPGVPAECIHQLAVRCNRIANALDLFSPERDPVSLPGSKGPARVPNRTDAGHSCPARMRFHRG